MELKRDRKRSLRNDIGNTNTYQQSKDYLELDDYMTALDYVSLNKLSTAMLMQRLKSHGLPYRGLKHELIQRWKEYKESKMNT